MQKQAELSGVITQIASSSIKIFYVPIEENTRNEVSYHIATSHDKLLVSNTCKENKPKIINLGLIKHFKKVQHRQN